MRLEEYCFLIGLMVIPFSFLFVPKIYFTKRLVLPINLFVLTLATIGLLASKYSVETNHDLYLFLLCPLFSLTILRIQLILFNRTLKRNPKDPPSNFFMDEDGMGWDRLFYFVYMILSLIVPIGLYAHLYS